jgi:hypothetical protein
MYFTIALFYLSHHFGILNNNLLFKDGEEGMIRLWGKLIKDSKILEDTEFTCSEDIEYQDQLKLCIKEICYKFDIQKPFWLPKNMEEYNRVKRTSFIQDNFMEEIKFDRFEIQVLEEK